MSRLIEVRGPSAQEADQGAEIVFVREDGGINSYIKACWTDGSYQQWGATTRVLGDNVEAVRTWAEGITAVHELIREDDDQDEPFVLRIEGRSDVTYETREEAEADGEASGEEFEVVPRVEE